MYVRKVLGLYAFLVVLYVFMIAKITNTIDGSKSLNKLFTSIWITFLTSECQERSRNPSRHKKIHLNLTEINLNYSISSVSKPRYSNDSNQSLSVIN